MFTAGAKVNRTGLKSKVPAQWIARPSVPSGPALTRTVLRRVAAEDATGSAEEAPAAPSAGKISLSDVVTGQKYNGVVKAVAAYGCFVDIGATTDGLVHISQLSNEYVKDVNSFVSVGQEVIVKVLGVEGDKKLSLSMKDDSASQTETRSEKRAPRTRRSRVTVDHGLSVGDKVTGTVERIANFGAFLKLESGFDVLLPTAEMSATEDSLDPNPNNLVSVGDIKEVTVLKVDGGKVSVTAISDEDRKTMVEASKGATSEGGPTALGGTMLGDLAALGLEEMFADTPAPTAAPAPSEAAVEETAPVEVEAGEEATPAAEAAPAVEEIPPEGEVAPATEAAPAAEAAPDVEEPTAEEEAMPAVEAAPTAEAAQAVEDPPAVEEAAPAEAGPAVEEPPAEEQAAPAAPAVEPATAAEDSAPTAGEAVGISAGTVRELRSVSGAGMMDCKKALQECSGDVQAAQEFLRKKGLASADKKASRVAAEGVVMSYIHAGSRLGVLVEVNCETDFVARGDSFKELAADIAMQIAACPDVKVVSVDDVASEDIEKEREIEMQKADVLAKPENIRGQIVEGRLSKIKAQQALLEQAFIRAEDGSSVAYAVKAKIAELGEKITVRRFVRYELGEGITKKEEDFAAEVAAQTEKKEEAEPEKPAEIKKEEPVAEEKPTVKVDLKLVKELRATSGAGMMDCKGALAACNNDLEEASAWLKKKGLASADKKSGRIAAEGVVTSYIHAGSSLGVLIEVNCETDFVSKGEVLQELAGDMAMQVAANPDVQYVSIHDIPQSVKDEELKIESGKEDLQGKPEAQIPRIVEGRVNKTLTKMCLLDQEYIKDTNKKVDVVIKEAIAKTGENVKVRRFTRYVLGEGIEKKVDDFAAEVAAQTGLA